MESPNAAKVRTLINFLRFDATDPKGFGAADKLGNMEIAVAEYLSNHFSAVVIAVDISDEIDAQVKLDKEMEA